MEHDNKEKNPFFKPALIATLLSVVGLVFLYCGIFIGFFLMTLTVPFVAILSGLGLVDGIKLQEPVKGCVFCLVISIFEALFFMGWLQAYLSKPICAEPIIVSHSYTSEEAESINEEIKRALGEKPERETEK